MKKEEKVIPFTKYSVTVLSYHLFTRFYSHTSLPCY